MPDAAPFDPYRTFKFRLRTEDGHPVAGLTRAGLPVFAIHAVRDEAPPEEPFLPVTLERGITRDAGFEQWASAVPGAPPPDAARRTLLLDVRNLDGRIARTYRLERCWPSAFQVLPEIDAQGHAVAIQILRLEHGGWEIIPSPAED